MFSFLTQIPLSEYIRKRRLTVAADDLQKGDKIINISQKYGYDSQAHSQEYFVIYMILRHLKQERKKLYLVHILL